MKMLISDYDYTIKPFENNPSIYERIVFKKNIDSIKRFIDRDNIFVIATGRTTSSIMDELKKYKINYSYLIAYNGRVIIDRNNKVIYANYLNQDVITPALPDLQHDIHSVYNLYIF